jgi:hypothetical protein
MKGEAQVSERWYVGDPQECPWQAGIARIAWGEVPTDEQRDELRILVLRPSPSQVLPALVPEWIAELPRCRELVLPILHLAELRPEQLPAMLDTLVFEASPRWLGPDGSGAPSWPSALCLPELRGLVIAGNMTSIPEGLRPELTPALARLSATMDKRGELIDRLAPFPNLRELELLHVANHDVFEPLDGEIEVLRLRGGGRHFPFDAITRWRSIVRLDLYDLQCTIDCEVLAGLPRLSEVRMSYCKKVVGVEALLECSELRSVTLVNCGRPFKDAALRQAFVDHGFEQLEITRA